MTTALLQAVDTSTTFSHFHVKPIAGRIGAKIKGLDLKGSLDPEVVKDIRRALIRYRVIFFRDQHLDEEQQIAFAQRFGSLTTAHPTVPALEGRTEVLDLDYGRTIARANNWHTDVTFVDRPPFGSILRAVTIPTVGGDTVWANTVAAYQDLPEHLRTLADSLWAVHSNAFDYAGGAVDLSEQIRDYRSVFASTVYETLHPVVRIHPESGERALLLGGFVRRFKGLSPSESHDLNRILQAHVTRLENTVRWRWKEGDVVFWDNYSTQHYAIADYDNQLRRVQRVTIAGDLPVAIDGSHSQVITGDSSSYIPE